MTHLEEERVDDGSHCHNCRFFRRGECRVKPPVLGTKDGCGRFPLVSKYAWCGHHEPVELGLPYPFVPPKPEWAMRVAQAFAAVMAVGGAGLLGFIAVRIWLP